MRKYVQYKCRCPQCGYTYTIEVYELPEGEYCPVCGHWGDLHDFLVPPPDQAVQQAAEILAAR